MVRPAEQIDFCHDYISLSPSLSLSLSLGREARGGKFEALPGWHCAFTVCVCVLKVTHQIKDVLRRKVTPQLRCVCVCVSVRVCVCVCVNKSTLTVCSEGPGGLGAC